MFKRCTFKIFLIFFSLLFSVIENSSMMETIYFAENDTPGIEWNILKRVAGKIDSPNTNFWTKYTISWLVKL